MNKATVRDLVHFDNAIDLACLDCLEGMLQVCQLNLDDAETLWPPQLFGAIIFESKIVFLRAQT